MDTVGSVLFQSAARNTQINADGSPILSGTILSFDRFPGTVALDVDANGTGEHTNPVTLVTKADQNITESIQLMSPCGKVAVDPHARQRRVDNFCDCRQAHQCRKT